MKWWFTADHHFSHGNIIEYCGRPFHSTKHMDMELIRRWNERVTDEDVVYHLGDFAFRGVMKPQDYLDQLNGQIIIIMGNHDRGNDVKSKLTSAVIRHGGLDIWMNHEPKAVYKFNFCGHIHDKWKLSRRGPYIIVNVGVDVWYFYPVDINEILKFLSSEGVKVQEIE